MGRGQILDLVCFCEGCRVPLHEHLQLIHGSLHHGVLGARHRDLCSCKSMQVGESPLSLLLMRRMRMRMRMWRMDVRVEEEDPDENSKDTVFWMRIQRTPSFGIKAAKQASGWRACH